MPKISRCMCAIVILVRYRRRITEYDADMSLVDIDVP